MLVWLPLCLLLLLRAPARADESHAITACLAKNGGGNGNLDVWISCIESAKVPQLDHDAPEEPDTPQEELGPVDLTGTGTVTETRDFHKKIHWLACAFAATLLAPLWYLFRGGRARVSNDSSTEIFSVCKPLGFALATVLHELLQGGKNYTLTAKDLEELLTCAITPVLFEALGDQSLRFADSLVDSFAKHYGVLAAVREKLQKASGSEAGESFKQSEVEPEKSVDGRGLSVEETILQRVTTEQAAKLMIPMLHAEKKRGVEMERDQGAEEKACDAGIQETISFTEIQSDGEEATKLTEKVIRVEERFEADLDEPVVACLQRQHSDTDNLVEKMEQLSLREGSCILDNRTNPLETFERSVAAQERFNYMKYLSLMQKERRLSIKEEELSFMKEKMTLNASKFSFKKSEFEDRTLAAGSSELCLKCADDFVTGVLVMGSYMAYGTWRNFPNWLADLRNTCMAELKESRQSRSWNVMRWAYNVAEDNGRLWLCMLRGAGVFVAGGILTVGVVMLVFRRLLSHPSQRMPFTIFLAGGLIAGFGGKLCIDLLGGDGRMWLLVWYLICLSHAASNYFALRLYAHLRAHPLRPLFFHLFLALLLPVFAAFVAFPSSVSM